ncbi:unnamed protein product [Mytilus coruscus]|uniref:Uncharacterized protein n=1 Tax=Mytilus coruscus TaxID=42192 RepID=A0A6J8CDZ7_MYTCO|nr:unnamed protein product [Mytilus coruscus]
MKTEAISLFGQEAPKRPTRVSDNAKEIRQRMMEYKQTNVEFLCEIPSVKCTTNGISPINTETPYIFPLTIDNEPAEPESKVETVLTETVSMIKEAYQICRRKATELLVWMTLIEFGTRKCPMMQEAEKCADNGIDVICSSFDGQWIKQATRTCEDKPLTLLQLQKDVWEKAKKAT